MLEPILASLLVSGALVPLLVALTRGRSRGVITLALALGIVAPAAAVWGLSSVIPRPVPESEVTGRPIEVTENGYVTSRTCRPCHPREYATWHGSYHRTMTQVVRPETVIDTAAFDGAPIEAFGQTYRHERVGDDFFIDMVDPDWEGEGAAPPSARVRKRLVLATGFHHMQVYWYPSGDAREIGLAPFAWLRDDRRWVPVQSTFLKPPLSTLEHKIGGWNRICNMCHSTGAQPRLGDSDDELDGHDERSLEAHAAGAGPDTVVAEFGIACESCHGPAEEHIRKHRNPARRYEERLAADHHDDSMVNPALLDAARSSEVCGQCHGIWSFTRTEHWSHWRQHGFQYRPGEELAARKYVFNGTETADDIRARDLLRVSPTFFVDRYWGDGMVRVSGREFSGLRRSPCFTHGDPERTLGCLHCHTMHRRSDDTRPMEEWANDQLAPGMDGNEACLQCHEDFRDRVAEHSHHAAGSPGSECMNCHMPYTTYGLLKAIRSHQIDSPSTWSTLTTRRPNACNQCHLDQTLVWTADHLEKWYGIAKPEQMPPIHNVFALSVIMTLSGDAGQRALMAWSMGWEPAKKASRSDWLAPYLAQLMMDPYDAVRYIAHRSLRRLPGYESLPYDFTAPEETRTAQAAAVHGRWRSLSAMRPTRENRLLIDENGLIRQQPWTQFFERRDNRRVSLEE